MKHFHFVTVFVFTAAFCALCISCAKPAADETPTVSPSQTETVLESASAITADELPQELTSELPDELPSELPAELPETFPVVIAEELPTELPETFPVVISEELPTELPETFPVVISEELPTELPASSDETAIEWETLPMADPVTVPLESEAQRSSADQAYWRLAKLEFQALGQLSGPNQKEAFRNHVERGLEMLDKVSESARDQKWYYMYVGLCTCQTMYQEPKEQYSTLKKQIKTVREIVDRFPDEYFFERCLMTILADLAPWEDILGDSEQAEKYMREALEIAHEIQSLRSDPAVNIRTILCYQWFADYCIRKKDLTEAGKYLEFSERNLKLIRESGFKDEVVNHLLFSHADTYAHLLLAESKNAEALAVAKQNLKEYESFTGKLETERQKRDWIRYSFSAAEGYFRTGNLDETRKLLKKGMAYMEEIQVSQDEPLLGVRFYRLLAQLEEGEKREEFLRKADEILDDVLKDFPQYTEAIRLRNEKE
ncbi:MAG: hypothetical protein IJD43_04245 [Thermoguttaceae bacterium]|nr:hypothetical protein [Thermoguttaceae bacterium]